jgi:hypothetical protein
MAGAAGVVAGVTATGFGALAQEPNDIPSNIANPKTDTRACFIVSSIAWLLC